MDLLDLFGTLVLDKPKERADAQPWQPRIISMADKDGDGVISKKELDEAKAVVAGS